jgi:hypothetical protein
MPRGQPAGADGPGGIVRERWHFIGHSPQTVADEVPALADPGNPGRLTGGAEQHALRPVGCAFPQQVVYQCLVRQPDDIVEATAGIGCIGPRVRPPSTVMTPSLRYTLARV